MLTVDSVRASVKLWGRNRAMWFYVPEIRGARCGVTQMRSKTHSLLLFGGDLMDTRLVRYFLRCTLSLIAAISLLTGVPLFAQAGTGGISGTVTDASGGAVPGATVTVLNPATGVSVESTTTGVGVYSFPSLPPAVYQVTVSKNGYSTSQNSNVTVTVDGVTTLNVALATGAVSQIVRVAATSQLVETSNSTVGQMIDNTTIARVPLLTRDVYQLVQLSAGVLPTNGVPNASDTQGIIQSRQNG